MAKYSKRELERAKFVKEQKLYANGGYKKAAFLTSTLGDYENHLYAYLIDLSICLLPVYAWGVEFILILSGVIPPAYFDLLFYIMYTLLFITSCILLPLYTASKGGYTWGGKMMGLRLVDKTTRRPASVMRLVMRELLGIGVPMMLFGYFFSVFGILLWWAINGLCVVLSPRQETIFDYIFGLVCVYVPRYNMVMVDGKDKDANQTEENARPMQASQSAAAQSRQHQTVQKSAPSETAANHTASGAQQTNTARTSAKTGHAQQSASNAYAAQSAPAKTAGVRAEAASAAAYAASRQAEDDISGYPVQDIDLHIRSNFSDDANAEVEDIFRLARDKHMRIISITDHNCARANSQAVRFARLYDIEYIPGVEIDCQLYGERVRILGYYIDWNNPFFDEIERLSLRREKDVSLERLQAFEKATGLQIDSDALLSNNRFKLLRPQELTDLVFDDPDARNLASVQTYLMSASSEEQARDAFMRDYFGPGGICEVKVQYPNARKVIEAIHEANGIAVLAGWHVRDMDTTLLAALIDAGLDGVEAFTPANDKATSTYLLEVAASEKLCVTAGSDYHGSIRPNRALGVTTMPQRAHSLVEKFTRAAAKPKPY